MGKPLFDIELLKGQDYTPGLTSDLIIGGIRAQITLLALEPGKDHTATRMHFQIIELYHQGTYMMAHKIAAVINANGKGKGQVCHPHPQHEKQDLMAAYEACGFLPATHVAPDLTASTQPTA
jgi:hypothetical protein